MSSFHVFSESIECDCGSYISVDVSGAIRDEIASSWLFPLEVDIKEEHECQNCGRGHALTLYAEAEDNEDDVTVEDFEVFNHNLEDLGIQAVYFNNKRYDLSDSLIGDNAGLPDGRYCLSYGEYTIANHMVIEIYNSQTDENQLTLELEEIAC